MHIFAQVLIRRKLYFVSIYPDC